MSYRSGKQKSGNVVLLAGYTHGAIGYDRSGADRKLVTGRDLWTLLRAIPRNARRPNAIPGQQMGPQHRSSLKDQLPGP
jgi:hypothetical protein